MNNITKFEPYFGMQAGGGRLGTSEYDRALREATGVTRVFYMYFLNLVTNMFEYENMPEGTDTDFLEVQLALQGKCGLVNDPNLGIINPQITPTAYNMYGRATGIDAYARDYNKSFNNPDDFVIVRNTNNYIPTFVYIDYFTQKIANLQGIESININAQKTPVIFKGTREQRVLLEEEFKKYDGNAWYMFIEKDAIGGIDSVNTNAPFIADKLNEQIRFYIDMFLTFIGLNNANGTYKRERSLVDEIQANNELIGITCDSMLKSRQKSFDEANAKWGTNMKVKYSEEVLRAINNPTELTEPIQLKNGLRNKGDNDDE